MQRSVSRMWNTGPEYLEGKKIVFFAKKDQIHNATFQASKLAISATKIAKKMVFQLYIFTTKSFKSQIKCTEGKVTLHLYYQ